MDTGTGTGTGTKKDTLPEQMLAKKEGVEKCLRCPKSRKTLKRHGDLLIAEGAANTNYYFVGDAPVLIDFSQSIVDEADLKNGSSSPCVRRNRYRGLLGLFKKIVFPTPSPTKKNVRYLLESLFSINANPRVLIVGGGTIGAGMNSFYQEPGVDLISFDIYLSDNISFLADAHSMPLPDDYFDAVIVQAVLEHVLDPPKVVSEIYRVLKTEGFVYSETPFLQHVHEGAFDFSRFTESGHRLLFGSFAHVRSGSVTGAGTQLLWSLDYFFRGLLRSRAAGKIAKITFFWLQIFDHIIPKNHNIDSAGCVFFLGKKGRPYTLNVNIASYYQGAQSP